MATPYYESNRAVSEYLLFHYGSREEILSLGIGPVDALGYPARCVTELLRVEALPSGATALDLGCAVGRSTFELARHCHRVIGIDYSHRFIEAARILRRGGEIEYEVVEEGELTRPATARIPSGIDGSRVAFEVGDALALREDLGEFDVVLMANLIDRLSRPEVGVRQAARRVKSAGQLLITSPYTWLEEYTPRAHWLGGFLRDQYPVRARYSLERILAPEFDLVKVRNLPFLIREHARKFQWSVAEATIWNRRR